MKRHTQKLLSEIPPGGRFVFSDWFDTRQMYEVERHYTGFRYNHTEEGKRVKGDAVPRTVTKVVRGSGVKKIFDNEGMYVLESTEE